MNTKEAAMEILDCMTEQQLQEFVHFFRSILEVPNAETKAAMDEVEKMKQHPEQYPGYTDIDDMMKDLLQ